MSKETFYQKKLKSVNKRIEKSLSLPYPDMVKYDYLLGLKKYYEGKLTNQVAPEPSRGKDNEL